ncbi:MAG: cystathionine gamma-synthase [Anaerolineales bacterium]|uniref:cystathionine gamma-synthase n=1 Tax=Promineifilum sp. TaxID=2664178 RepID=UPI001D45B942|nr:cystathionine gamma-synthase [Anaerolineales bacterium]MCB8935558.1 cystathionine gamma-synthase [Promineifilum sp.]MCO5180645.1 cystathionine gamma-synthase [Promineifilum sp.]
MTTPTNDHFDTLAVHAGVHADPATGAIMTPIYQTSTFVQTDINEHKGYDYARAGNPTRTALEEALAALEGGRFGLSFASGMAAIDTVLRLVRPGERVLCGNDLYGGTFRLFDKVLADYGIVFDYVDTTDTAAVREALAAAPARLVWLETPTNPTLRLTDIAAVSSAARAAGAWVAVDNTFASPALQRPLALGADFVLHSTTKYLGGHSDVVGGAVVLNDEAAYERLKFLQKAVGAVSGPMDCFLTLRGIKTLGIRMRAHCDNGLAVAQFLEDHPAVERVFYPGLESHPQYELARRQMAGPGGMVSFTLHGGEAAARAVARRTRLFTLAESLGGVESLIELPSAMTHASVAGPEALAAGFAVDAGLVRLSVGIEHPDDLIADLQQALAGV